MGITRGHWIAVLAACCIASSSSVAQDLAAGHAVAEKFCAACHAIKPGQKSKHRLALTFPAIANRYSVWGLQEALAEGILVGHGDMPKFIFAPEEINNLLTYMDTFTDKKKQKTQ